MKIYGDWKDGSVIFKDKTGYYVIQYNPKTKKDYKKYIKSGLKKYLSS